MTLSEIQKKLIRRKLDALIITRNNMFLGQDVLPEENLLRQLSGFTGSAGNLIVFRDKAVLLVDGRYELQAAQETDPTRISVVCTTDSLGAWMQKNLAEPCVIGYDAWCHSISETDYWNRTLKRHTFVDCGEKILPPRLSSHPAEIFEHDIKFCGVSMDEKISYLTDFMNQNGLDAYFICECDAVSWLMNLRSSCLPDTPLLRAFALVDHSGEVSLFTTDMKRIENELAAYKGKEIGLSFNQTPKQLQNIMKNLKIWLVNLADPIQKWKAVKNPVELDGIRRAHHRDGIAMVRFLHWLDHHRSGLSELDVVSQLRWFRAKGENFFSDSFGTIAGSGPNGAIVHYQPNENTNRMLDNDSVLLLDSGAQYYDGTTDITRTIALGNPPQEIKDSFTQVLKAHIAAVTAIFPADTSGCAIDAIARSVLWRYGKDYKHGTGHGVGCFLNVHEGPQGLSPRNSYSPLQPGMICSVEPGYYHPGSYGIRIENLAVITEVKAPEFPQPMLSFETLTLAPIDKRLINKYLLTWEELDWVNQYHRRVEAELGKELDADVLKWLKQACAPL